jgi:putative endonuclease
MATTIEQGGSAEADATTALVRMGYRILERNFRCRAGELDIVARDGDVLAFVEVRSRADADHGHAAEMIGVRKQRQVARVAAHYVAHRALADCDQIRFDVVAITGGDVQLIKDAWRL